MAGIILVAGSTERPLYGPQPGKTEEDFERDFAQSEVRARMVPFEHSARFPARRLRESEGLAPRELTLRAKDKPHR